MLSAMLRPVGNRIGDLDPAPEGSNSGGHCCNNGGMHAYRCWQFVGTAKAQSLIELLYETALTEQTDTQYSPEPTVSKINDDDDDDTLTLTKQHELETP